MHISGQRKDNMKRMNLLIMVILTSLFWACEKNNPIVEPPEEEKVFELEWATRMDFAKEIVGTDNTQHYKDWVLVGGDLGFPPTIMAFNKETGNKDWQYIHEGNITLDILYSEVVANIYVAICGDGILGIDLETRTPLWIVDFDEANYTTFRGLTVYEGYVYTKIIRDFKLSTQTVELLKINPLSGEVENLLSTFDNYNYGVSPPAFYNDLDNDRTLMVINEYPTSDLPEESTQNIMAIDLETKEVVWKTENFTNFFASNGGHPPIIYNNLVITGGDWHIYAFDIKTGEQVWSYEETNTNQLAIWGNTNHLIQNDRLYVNATGFNITCLNPQTGELIWNNPNDAPNCTDNMVYYQKEDFLVFTSWGYGSVMILDALTGETLHREHHYDESQYNNDLVYDEDRDMFFTSTYKHAVGFRVQRVN